MGISATTKRMSVALFAIGLMAGCASTQENMSSACEGTSPDVQKAIDEAKAKNADAREMGADWRETQETIKKAEKAGSNCNDDKAMELAKEARMDAKNQIALQEALQEAAEQSEEDQTVSEEEPTSHSYTVEQGDTLWGISGSSDGYNNPYEWPLIYKANQGKIDDADLIYPGQNFMIKDDPSADAVDAAIDHAKNRGDWSLGRTEQSDLDYLDSAR